MNDELAKSARERQTRDSIDFAGNPAKIRIFALLLVAISLIASACQPDSGDEPVISFMVFGDPAERDAYLSLVAAFHETGPGIAIEVTHIPSPRDYRTRLVTEFAAGTPPDITLMNYRRYASFAARELLEPLGPFLASSERIAASDYYPITIQGFTWDGQIMCIPQNISSLVVYYNAHLFDATGVDYPADDWTWTDFLATATQLTLDLDGDGRTDQFGLGIEPSLFRLAPFIWQNNAPLVDDEEQPTRLTLTRPPALEALAWFVALRTEHGVVPGLIEEAAQDSENRFLAGTTAMYLNSRRGTPTYRRIDAFNWDVAPLPRGRSQAGVLHSDGYCLSKTATNKEAAWAFIEFANSPEGQAIVATSGRTVPSLISVAESEAFLDPDQPPVRAAVFLDNAADLRLVPVISTWQEIEDVASAEIERAFYGDISVEEAANLIDLRTEEYFVLATYARD